MDVITAQFGTWKSPITPSMITEGGVSLSSPQIDGDTIYWLESRPTEAGRTVIVRGGANHSAGDGGDNAEHLDVTPKDCNVRTLVHEYGGGDYLAHDGAVYFSNFDDQRIYRQPIGGKPEPITPEPESEKSVRFADFRITPDGRHLICVRETHKKDGEPINELVAIALDGTHPPLVIASGHDFYSSPRISPDGRTLAWLTWDHPRMPWDGTDLWIAPLDSDGKLEEQSKVAGGAQESILQPEWSPQGVLHFVSDRTDWWNLYAVRNGSIEALAPMEAEFGGPQWIFGLANYAFLSGGRIAAVFTRDGTDHLAILSPDSNEVETLDVPYSNFGRGVTIVSDGDSRLLFVGASPTRGPAVILYRDGEVEVLKKNRELELDPGVLSKPRPIEFPTSRNRTAHALYYPPKNTGYQAPAGELPPLIVRSHGGPTTATTSELTLPLQYWTSRGFAVVDVNYGGSTGYGRPYRERLRGEWGVVDTEDCINAARYLVDQGEVDGSRLAIRGGSAGGYTTLCALVMHDLFAAGASYYGVADLEALAKDTHKFESHYTDSLVGPYPERIDLYKERSPVHFTDQLSCPVILFQGLDDPVVPPSQAEMMVDALRSKKIPYAYITFEGEQHGFRQAKNIERAMEAELYFYARVFGFDPPADVEPVEIEFL